MNNTLQQEALLNSLLSVLGIIKDIISICPAIAIAICLPIIAHHLGQIVVELKKQNKDIDDYPSDKNRTNGVKKYWR